MQEVMKEDEDPPFGKTLRERVLVPFPIESDLSGNDFEEPIKLSARNALENWL